MASDAYLRRKRQEEMGIIQPVTSKRCRHCGQTKDRDEFPPSKMVSDGLSSWCRVCHRAGTQAWREREHASGRRMKSGRVISPPG
jgi:hypothetical protein